MSDTFEILNRRLITSPFMVQGEVVKGFGRGSKELGIPTANFPEIVVKDIPSELSAGVYYGWSRVDNGEIYKMVLSIGWNPFYKNEKKSMETHILHEFDCDFYGSTLRIVMTGYIRPELNFGSLTELVDAIKNDIAIAHSSLEKSDHISHKFLEFIQKEI
ncbi:putative riboflavin kinase [Hydra vulgaris]|uniref:riboflavin kinase n=1 Tax=Hydra vulgaris TaxID=6087 RepID=A0ABM4CQ01_HYDVU